MNCKDGFTPDAVEQRTRVGVVDRLVAQGAEPARDGAPPAHVLQQPADSLSLRADLISVPTLRS